MQYVTDFRAGTIADWADFAARGGPDTDRCRTARCGAGPETPRTTQILVNLAAHVGPLPGLASDARSVFLALRPGIDVFLDLIDGPYPKALRLVAEAGVSTWREPEIAAGALSLVQSCDLCNCVCATRRQGLLRRLLSALSVPSRARVAELCLSQSSWYVLDVYFHRVVARHAPLIDRWRSTVTSMLARRLCPDVAAAIVELATTIDDRDVAAVQARHLERLVDLEVRRAECEFVRGGAFSRAAFLAWAHANRSKRYLLSDAIRHCALKLNVPPRCSESESGKNGCRSERGNIKVYEVDLYGKTWTLAERAGPPASEDEILAFLLKHRTKTPEAYDGGG